MKFNITYLYINRISKRILWKYFRWIKFKDKNWLEDIDFKLIGSIHVKIPENYFKFLKEGKNVGKFIFGRNVKISENEPSIF